MTFVKGQSGNPGGRIKPPPGLAEHRKNGPVEMLDFLRGIVRDTVEAPSKRKNGPPELVPKHTTQERLTASKYYLEYTLPKPQQESGDMIATIADLVEAIRAKPAKPPENDDDDKGEP